MSKPVLTRSYSLGLALSGGGFRGVAHIGVLRALDRHGLHPDFLAGTSAGSLVAALYASGRSADEIVALAAEVFWPALLRSQGLRSFCRRYLPHTFRELALPLRVAVTALPAWKTEIIDSGDLAPALEASCAVPYLLRQVRIGPTAYTDGGWNCVLPAAPCRTSCRTVIGSDVWLRAAMARRTGVNVNGRWARPAYSRHYLRALSLCDVAIHCDIPALAIVPNRSGIDRLIASGEATAEKALAGFSR